MQFPLCSAGHRSCVGAPSYIRCCSYRIYECDVIPFTSDRNHKLSRKRIRKCRGRSIQATSNGGEPLDIDFLAQQLSREAERLRRELSEKEQGGQAASDIPSSAPTEASSISSNPSKGPFGYESKEQEAAVLAEIGDGGFCAADFEVVQQLGRLAWVTETAREDPLQVTRNLQQQTAIIAFMAQYYSGRPFQDPVNVLLKEYLPGAKSVACNELQILAHLTGGLPNRKWHAAVEPMAAHPPIVPLLGYFWAQQSDAGASVTPASTSGSSEEVLWLVYKYERLQPLSYYAVAEQTQPMQGMPLLWGAVDRAEEALRARCMMLRRICGGVLRALAYCHRRGVAHGSLGPGSILLSTFRDCRAQDLVVKLDNFGFAQLQKAAIPSTLYPSPRALDPDHPLSLAQREDLKAAGLALLETVVCALAEGGPSDATSADALQRLLFEVFASDVNAFRRHCSQEPDWTMAAILLDEYEGAGWQLITDLISGTKTADELLDNAFIAGT